MKLGTIALTCATLLLACWQLLEASRGSKLLLFGGNEPSLDFTNAVGVYGMGPDPGANTIPWHTAGANTGQRVWDFSTAANHLQPGSTNGTDTNDPTKTAAGYSFATDDYLLASTYNISPVSGYTISALVRTSASGAYASIVDRDPSGGNRCFQFRKTDADKLNAIFFRDDGSLGEALGDTNIADGEWHMVSATWDGVAIRVFVDGAIDGDPVAFSGPPESSDARLSVGAIAGSGLYWNGDMASLVIHKTGAINIATESRVIYNYICLSRGLDCIAPSADLRRWERLGYWAALLPFGRPPDPLGLSK